MRFSLSRLFIISLIAQLSYTGLYGQERDFKSVKTPYSIQSQLADSLDKLIKEEERNAALEYIDATLPILKRSNDYEGLTYFLERKAYILRLQKLNDKALGAASQAVVTAKRHLLSNHFLLAKSYYRKGYILHKINDYYDAASNLDSSQTVYSNSPNYDSAMYNSLVEYKYYAYSYGAMSVDTVVKYLDLRMRKELSNKPVDPNEVLYIMNDFAKLYLQKGDYSQALAYAIEEVTYARENPESIEKQRYLSARFNLALVLYRLRDYERGLKICNEALEETSDAKGFFGRVNQKEANLINAQRISIKSLRVAFFIDINLYEEAINELVLLIEENNGLNERFIRQQKINLAKSYLGIENFDRAKFILNEVLNELRPTFPNIQAESLFLIEGELSSKLNLPEMALLYYDSALRNSISEYHSSSILDFPNTKNSKLPIDALFTLQRKTIALNNVYQKMYSDSIPLISAVNKYVNGTHDLIMNSRQELIRTEGRLFLSSSFKALYEAGIEASYYNYKNYNKEEGFLAATEFFRLSKALLFLEQSGEFSDIQNTGIPQDFKNQFYKLKKEINTLNETFYEILDSVSPISDSVAVINRRLLTANDSLQLVKNRILEFIRKNKEISVSNENNRSDQLKNNEALIEYFVGKGQVFVLAKTKEKSVFERFIVTPQFEANLKDILDEVSQAPSFINYNEKLALFSRNSYFIYQQLLENVLSQLGNKVNHLTIVPDEYLSQLPFEILLSDKSAKAKSFSDLPYLMNSYTINYELSSANNGTKSIEDKAPKNLLGIGYSVSDRSAEFAQLPGTDREVNFLQSKIEGTYYQGGMGTKEIFLSEARDYDIIHLAVHGIAGTEGQESSLIFNGSDGVLKTSDLYMAGLRARLAVLSACESGGGEMSNGEGVFSIARGFSIVGVPSVVMSLWSVNDQVTSGLMVQMYRFLQQGLPIDEAVVKTKRDYLENSDSYTGHPYYWAAFVSLGEPIQINQKKTNWVLWASIIAILLLLIFTIYMLSKKRKRII